MEIGKIAEKVFESLSVAEFDSAKLYLAMHDDERNKEYSDDVREAILHLEDATDLFLNLMEEFNKRIEASKPKLTLVK